MVTPPHDHSWAEDWIAANPEVYAAARRLFDHRCRREPCPHVDPSDLELIDRYVEEVTR